MKSDELKLIPPLNQNGLKLVLDPLMLQPKDSISAVQGLNAAEGDAVVIVDTFSTGALLANMLYKMKFKVLNEYFFLIFVLLQLLFGRIDRIFLKCYLYLQCIHTCIC